MSDIKLPYNIPTSGNQVTDFNKVVSHVKADNFVADSEVTALQGVLQQMNSGDAFKAMKALQGSDPTLHMLVKNGWSPSGK